MTRWERLFWFFGVFSMVVGMCFFVHPKQTPETNLVFMPAQATEPAVYPMNHQNCVTFPVTFPGSGLTVQDMAVYEGPFSEDGSADNVTDVAAVILCNSSDQGIAYGEVTLQLDESQYSFVFTYLPPGGRILVPEASRKPYRESCITDCRCVKLVRENFSLAQDKIRVTSKGMAGVVLENKTDQTLQHVYLRYKLHLNQEDIYIGGVTYRLEVGTLQPGQTVEVTPEHFVWGYSAIVEICTGEE